MKRLCFLLLGGLLTLTAYAKSDSTRYQLAYRIEGIGGMMMKDDKVDPFIKGPMLGGTFAVEFLPTGRWKSLQEWNNTSIGVGATYINLGNQQMLGDVIAIHGHLNTPFVTLPHFIIGLRPTVGMAFCTKRYSNTYPAQNYKKYESYANANQSIGSVVNAFLGLQLYMDFPVQDGFDITLAYGWQHISNGSIIHPNGGYNMFNGELGMRYTPGLSNKRIANGTHYQRPPTRTPRRLYDGVEKKWDVDIVATGGIKQNYYKDNQHGMQFFGVASLGVSAHWQPVSIFKIGAGIDAFYDGYYACVSDEFQAQNPNAKHITYFGKTYLKESNVKNCFRVGISVQPEFIIGKLTAGIHIGFYVFDPIKNLEPYEQAKHGLHRGVFYAYDFSKASTYQDGWLYTRFILNYQCTQHLFVQIGLKTHGVRAEFLDAGLGIRI